MPSGRGQGPTQPISPEKVGLPIRPFLYTLDQIGAIIQVKDESLRSGAYIYFDRRSIGVPTRDLMIARNIAPDDKPPEWRIAEQELIRWMKVKGFKFYDRSFLGY